MTIELHHVNVTVPPELEAATKDFYGAVVGLEHASSYPGLQGLDFRISARRTHMTAAGDTSGSTPTHLEAKADNSSIRIGFGYNFSGDGTATSTLGSNSTTVAS